jgi:hypothetical protein
VPSKVAPNAGNVSAVISYLKRHRFAAAANDPKLTAFERTFYPMFIAPKLISIVFIFPFEPLKDGVQIILRRIFYAHRLYPLW